MGRSLKQARVGMILVGTSDLARRHRDDPIALGYELGRQLGNKTHRDQPRAQDEIE